MEILSGILVSLLALFPPIRRWAQSSENARVTILLTLGILSFIISFGLHMWLVAAFEVYFAYFFAPGLKMDCGGLSGPMSCPEQEFFRKTPNAQTELWIRLMVPPPPSITRYSQEYIPLGWDAYWRTVTLVFVLSVPITVALGALFTSRASRSWILLWWVLASSVGGAVGTLLSEFIIVRAVNLTVGGAASGAAIGAAIGAMQWLVLRRRVSYAGWWILASCWGWAIGGFVIGPVLEWRLMTVALSSLMMMIVMIIWAAVSGITAGTMQWLVLRWQIPRAGWWVLASSLGWAWAIMGAGVIVVIEPTLALVWWLGGAIGGIVGGLITGIALVWLLRHPVPEG